MILLQHEFRQTRKALLIWTLSIGLFIAVCIFMFPEIESEMDSVRHMFSSMGAFSEAFGMDQMDMGTLIGFYAVECGNILGLGSALFAALVGISALSKEERGRTAEFLLTHPLRRRKIVTEKLLAVVLLVLMLNVVVFAISITSIVMIGKDIPWQELSLLHFANFIMQLEIMAICFGLSAFLRRSGTGVGLGLAAGMYFLNIVANISENAGFLDYITPFTYTDGADILNDKHLNWTLVILGLTYSILAIAIAYGKYSKKDISS